MAERTLAVVQPDAAAVMEQVIIKGDLGQLTPEQRARYYMKVAESVGLNPMTKPFEYIVLNGKLQLYALKNATDQLRKIHAVSVIGVEEKIDGELLVVTVHGRDKTGREDVEIGAVTVGSLRGDARANALMKALTKAKRRLTLSMCGLGMLDESEVETIPNARPFQEPAPVANGFRETFVATRREQIEAEPVVDQDTGEILAEAREVQRVPVIEGFTQLWPVLRKHHNFRGTRKELEEVIGPFGDDDAQAVYDRYLAHANGGPTAVPDDWKAASAAFNALSGKGKRIKDHDELKLLLGRMYPELAGVSTKEIEAEDLRQYAAEIAALSSEELAGLRKEGA